VTPRRFDGVRLDLVDEIPVDGYPPIRVELYLSRGAERPAVHLACAGTLVAENLADVDVLGFEQAPWVGRDLTGIIDFPAFQVPPGTRRGVVPNAAAVAFARALATLETAITQQLDQLDRRRRVEADRHIVDELRKALRGLRDRMPHYDLPAVEGGRDTDETASSGRGMKATLSSGDLPASSEHEGEEERLELFPPGPLSGVVLKPQVVEVPIGAQRRVTARAHDANGRRITDVELSWTLQGMGFELVGGGARPAVRASDGMTGCEALLSVEAKQGGLVAHAVARVVAVDEKHVERAGLGIPTPELVDASGAAWRSRMENGAWQVNAGHEDYLGLEDGRARLRYLIALLGKEIVQRTYAQPGAGELLEHLVAVIAHAERNLRG
jgi:hypothetical protein